LKITRNSSAIPAYFQLRLARILKELSQKHIRQQSPNKLGNQRNMKKILIPIIIIVPLAAVIIYYSLVAGRTRGPQLPPKESGIVPPSAQFPIKEPAPMVKEIAPAEIPVSGLTAYETLQGGFGISYPERFSAKKTTQERVIAGSMLQRYYDEMGLLGFISIYIPASEFPSTNFSEAEINVAAANVSTCNLSPYAESLAGAGTAEISGRTFNKFTAADAAAGSLYATTVFSRAEGNRCYIVEEIIHTTNIQNYDPSLGIRAYNEPRLRKLLNSIINNLRLSA